MHVYEVGLDDGCLEHYRVQDSHHFAVHQHSSFHERHVTWLESVPSNAFPSTEVGTEAALANGVLTSTCKQQSSACRPAVLMTRVLIWPLSTFLIQTACAHMSMPGKSR